MPDGGQLHSGRILPGRRRHFQPFIDQTTDGVFGTAIAMFATDDRVTQTSSDVDAISCVTPGNCTAALSLTTFPPPGDPDPQGFLTTETDGTWGPLRAIPGEDPTLPTTITSVSCWGPANCMAVGNSGRTGSERPILAIQEGRARGCKRPILRGGGPLRRGRPGLPRQSG